MGAWGVGPFDNDSALVVVGDIVDGRFDVDGYLRRSEAAYLDHEVGVETLVLVELSLVLLGEQEPPVDGLEIPPATLAALLTPDRMARVLAIAPRVLRPGVSEEYDLWSASGDFDEWRTTVTAAIGRLRDALDRRTRQPAAR